MHQKELIFSCIRRESCYSNSIVFFIRRTAPLLMRVWPVIAQWSFHRDSMLFVVTMGLQFTHETNRLDKSFIDANASQDAVICICFPLRAHGRSWWAASGSYSLEPSLCRAFYPPERPAGQAMRESGHLRWNKCHNRHILSQFKQTNVLFRTSKQRLSSGLQRVCSF